MSRRKENKSLKLTHNQEIILEIEKDTDDELSVVGFETEEGVPSSSEPPFGLRSTPSSDMPSNDPSNTSLRRLFLLTIGTCAFFMACSVIEELTFRRVPGFKYSGFLTTYELFGFALFAFAQLLYDMREHLDQIFSSWDMFHSTFATRAPMKSHLLIAVAMATARALTNMSLLFLNYPTQVLFKSLKLPVVVFASVAFLSKTYGTHEYVSAFFLAMSAAFFSLGDVAVVPSFDPTGVFIVCLSLVGDAVHCLYQEVVLRNYNARQEEILLYSNSFGFLIAMSGNLVSSELVPAIRFFNRNPWLWLILGLRTVLVYAGVVCYVKIIKSYGIVTATTVTTVRKILTICVSFYVFPKPMSWKYLLALVVFCGGIYIKLLGMQGSSPPSPSKSPGKNSEAEQEIQLEQDERRPLK